MASIAPNTICSRTAKGLAEVRNKSGKLSRENGIVLQCIDGKKRLNELQSALGMTMAHLLEAIETLIAQGFVHEVAAVRQTEVSSVRQTVAKSAPEDDDLDFSSPEAIAEFNRQTESEARARGGDSKKQDTEAKKRAVAEAKQRAEVEAKKRAEAEVKKRAEAEAKQRAEAEAKKRAAAEENQRAEAEARKRAEAEVKRRADAEAKQRAEAEAKQRAEAERQAREEAERKAREEAERKAREEAERKAREEAERKAREEAERKAREEAERKAREEAERKAREEAERKAREEAERKAREEAERKAREEAERKAREEAERKAREEAERKAREEAERKAREEAERKAREEAERKAREEAERKAREEAERREREEALRREREEAEQRERELAERRAREEAERREREEALRREREEAERRERDDRERRAREEAELREREEALRREREDAERREREEATASATLDAQSAADTHAPEHVPAEASAAREEHTEDEIREQTNAAADTHESGEAAPDQSAIDLVQKLKAKVKAERHARVQAERWSTQPPKTGVGLDSSAQPGQSIYSDTSQPGTESPYGSTGSPEPIAPAQYANFVQETEVGGTAPDAASPLERAMLDSLAQNPARSSDERASHSSDSDSESPAECPPARAFHAMDEASIPIADNLGPPHQRLNADRAAHDALADAASARHHDQSRVLGTHASGDRLHDVNEDARRASRFEQKKRRARVFASVGVMLVAAPVVGALCLQFMPLNGYIPEAQQALSEQLKQPTKIKTLRYVLLPSPRVVLEGVNVGNGIHIDRIEAPALPHDLSAVPRVFETVSAHGITIDAETLGTIPSWSVPQSATAMRVQRLKLDEVKLNAPDSELTALKGEATFKADGTLHQAYVGSEKLRLDVAPMTNGLRLALTARDSRIPFGPAVKFNEFTISGVAEEQRFTSTELSGRVAGGSLEGTLKASWSGPVAVNGEFKVQKLRLEELVPLVASDSAVNGVLTASGRYALQSQTADGLMTKPRVEASFSLARGELTNLDLVRATQSSGSSSFGGGRTSFEEAKGTLKIAEGQYDYRLQLSSGPLNANGAFAVNPAGQLSGRITTELAARSAEVTRTALKVVGTFKEPQLAH
ncbi:MAG: hypothetical protein ACXWCY_00875 [Burkholderiales bacterium]